MNIDVLIVLECIVVAIVSIILGISIKLLNKGELIEVKKKTEYNKDKQANYKTIVETAEEIVFLKDDEEFHYKKS